MTVRQLNYWTDKGLVRALGAPGKKRYDFRALERVALIKRALTDGYSLEEAAAQAATLLRTQPLNEAEARTVILERLSELEELVFRLRQYLNQAGPEKNVADSARQLLRLNVSMHFDEKSALGDGAGELATDLGQARDQVHRAVDALLAEGTKTRPRRTYRRRDEGQPIAPGAGAS